MCMTFAVDHPIAGPFVVTDRRLSLHLETGTGEGRLVSSVDCGGRLIRLSAGRWGLGVGQAPYAFEAMTRVVRAKPASVDEFGAVLRGFAKTLPTLKLRYPVESFDLDGHRTHFLYVTPDGVFALLWDGSPMFGGKGQQLVSYPSLLDGPALTDRRARFQADMCRLMSSPFDYLRRAAAEFAEVAEFAETVSPTIEVGWDGKYLTADSRSLSAMDDGQIRGLLRDAPSPQSQFKVMKTAHETQKNDDTHRLIIDGCFHLGTHWVPTGAKSGPLFTECVPISLSGCEPPLPS